MNISDEQIIQNIEDFKGQSIFSIDQFSLEAIDIILKRAKDIKLNPQQYLKKCEGQHLIIDFESPSTRTIVSTQVAWSKLGGTCIILNAGGSITSRAKGETLNDHFKTICDLDVNSIAIRCKKEFFPQELATKFNNVSWINCGDGKNEHPTQSLLDLFTIYERLNITNLSELEGKKIGFVGDIKHSRTIHSLAKLLELMNCQIHFIAHNDLHYKEEYLELTDTYRKHDLKDLDTLIGEMNVIYATRNQAEVFDPETLEKYKKGEYDYLITPEMVENEETIIMHPLPRVKEIDPRIDSLPNCAYFNKAGQINNGVYVRMALFSLFNKEKKL